MQSGGFGISQIAHLERVWLLQAGEKLVEARFEGAHLQVRGCNGFIFVIPSGLQPARNLLFGVFPQPVKPCPFKPM